MANLSPEEIADKLANEVKSSGKSKKIKVRTLMDHFNYERRTEDNSAKITELFAERNILLNPSIMKLGESWPLKLDDRVYLAEMNEEPPVQPDENETINIYDFKSDKWFDDIVTKQYRTEKEVENKFIIPLLNRLGYSEDDRYDGMTVKASHGSKHTILEVDFALFDDGNENLEGQTLLVVEAKKKEKLIKQVELENAKNQVKSYAVWLSCHFGLVTDGITINVFDLFPKIKKIDKEEIPLFECSRENLKDNFYGLYKLISKESLVKYYDNIINK